MSAALLCACADFGGPIGPGGTRPPTQEELKFQELDRRLAQVTRKVDNLQTTSAAEDIMRLEADIRRLRGEIETLRYEAQTRERRERELYLDLDQRIQRLENQSRPPSLSLESNLSDVPPVPPSQEEEAAYVASFNLLRDGDYEAAIAGFREQIARWPDGRYAPNALYWTAEAQSASQDFAGARKTYQELLDRFPSSDKAPDALFKRGVAEAEEKAVKTAAETWKKVIADYPDSNAAKLAKQRLDAAKPPD